MSSSEVMVTETAAVIDEDALKKLLQEDIQKKMGATLLLAVKPGERSLHNVTAAELASMAVERLANTVLEFTDAGATNGVRRLEAMQLLQEPRPMLVKTEESGIVRVKVVPAAMQIFYPMYGRLSSTFFVGMLGPDETAAIMWRVQGCSRDTYLSFIRSVCHEAEAANMAVLPIVEQEAKAVRYLGNRSVKKGEAFSVLGLGGPDATKYVAMLHTKQKALTGSASSPKSGTFAALVWGLSVWLCGPGAIEGVVFARPETPRSAVGSTPHIMNSAIRRVREPRPHTGRITL